MKIKYKLICVLFCLACPLTVFALEPSRDVKVTQILKTTDSWDNKPIVYPSGEAEITGLLVEVAPGGQTGWHLHAVPSFAVILEGDLQVNLEDGRMKRFKAGDALAEVINTLHNGRNIGNIPVKLVVFYAGTAGQPITVKQDEITAGASSGK